MKGLNLKRIKKEKDKIDYCNNLNIKTRTIANTVIRRIYADGGTRTPERLCAPAFLLVTNSQGRRLTS